MSNQMSTSIQNLPEGDLSSAHPMNDDPMVNDVLAEMEREVTAAKNNNHPQFVNRPTHVPTQSSQQNYGYANHAMPSFVPPYIKEPSKPWLNLEKLQTAVIASVVAWLLLIPNISFVYEKFEKLSTIKSYELLIRVALLAVVLYIAMIRLNL